MNLKAGNSAKNMNPIICADFPEPDVIRVGDTYYMICATMHFFPGGTLLKSYDLVHWEIAAHVFERLDDTPAEQFERSRKRHFPKATDSSSEECLGKRHRRVVPLRWYL